MACKRFENFKEESLSVNFKSAFGTPIKKRIFAGIFIIFVFFTAFVCAYIFLKSKPRQPKSFDDVEVVPIAGLNSSVDPCSNFYQFTCGSWPGNLTEDLPDDYNYYDSFGLLKNIVRDRRKEIFVKTEINEDLPRVVNDALKFYNNCQILNKEDTSDISFMLDFFDRMGGWPILNPKWNGYNFDWVKATAYLLKNLDFETILGLHPIIDDKNSSSNILYIKMPTFRKKEDMLGEHFNQIVLMTVLYTINPHMDEKLLFADIEEIHKTEVLWSRNISYFENATPTKISFHELRKRIPNFDFLSFINLVMNDSFFKYNVRMSEDDVIFIDNIDYFENVIAVMQSNIFTKRQIANLFGWFAIQDMFLLIPDAIRNYGEANDYTEEEIIEAAELQCFDKVVEIYECSVDYLYVQNTPQSGVADSEVLVRYLKKAFKETFTDSDWLDESTKIAAINKLDSLQTILGFKEYHSDKAALDHMYREYPSVTENILETYIKIKQSYVSDVVQLLKHGNNFQTDYLPRSITDVSAYYILQVNALAIPISLHSPPFYYRPGPSYMNFGALGVIIGHEIMHAFDNLGSRRGENGSLKNWWTNSSLEKYDKRYECFKHQYSFYPATNNSVMSATLNENVADNVGLHMAYRAYKLWVEDNVPEGAYPLLRQYSAEQMFFISFGSVWCALPGIEIHLNKANVHSSPELRVTGAVSNSQQFAEAFKCRIDSPMNPRDKCYLW